MPVATPEQIDAESLALARTLKGPASLDDAEAHLAAAEDRVAPMDDVWPNFDANTFGDLGSTLSQARAIYRERERAAAWHEYLEDPESEELSPPNYEAADAEALRYILRQTRAPGLARMLAAATERRDRARRALARIADELDAYGAEYASGAGGATLVKLVDRRRELAAERAGLRAVEAATSGAIDGFRAAFPAKAAAAIGSTAPVVQGMREVRQLAGAFADGGSPEVDALRAELVEVQLGLDRLGSASGLLKTSLAARKTELEGLIQSKATASLNAATATLTTIVEAAKAGDVDAWQEVMAMARDTPDAFPAGLHGRLIDSAVESLAAGGATAFADALEGE